MGAKREPKDAEAEAAELAALRAAAPIVAAPSPEPQPEPPNHHEPPDNHESAKGAPRGQWRSQAAGSLLAPIKRVLIAAGLVQALITLVELAPYVLLVELARMLLSGDHRLGGLAIATAALLGAGVALALALTIWLHAVDARYSRDLRKRLLGKLSRLPLGWFTDRSSGSIKKLVQDDTLALHYLVTHAIPDAVAAILAPLAVLVYLFVIDWRLALVMLVPILAYIVTMWIMVIQSGANIARAGHWKERMNAEAGGYLDGQPVIRIFGGAAASTFRLRLEEYLTFLRGWQLPYVGKKTFMDIVTRPATFLLLIMVVGTAMIVGGTMEPVDLLPFLLLGTTFGARLLGIGYGLSSLREGLVAAREIAGTLREPELLGREGRTGLRPKNDGWTQRVSARPGDGGGSGRSTGRGLVEFDDVSFSYRPGVPVIENVSLGLEPGSFTALVGPSGSGKSTLAGLLARFHDVDAGAIRVDGHAIDTLDPDALYTQVGFVFQDSQLVAGTVAENIALAVPDAPAERIEAAARAAQIHDRILRLPDGYATMLGADAQLSGGERQRLTIARAILADTPVLVLDEATAFADPESEYLVQRALDELAHDRTVLMIAHRLRTITEADQIVVLDHGRVVETGTHAQLLDAGGRYRRLWESGAAASLEEAGVAL